MLCSHKFTYRLVLPREKYFERIKAYPGIQSNIRKLVVRRAKDLESIHDTFLNKVHPHKEKSEELQLILDCQEFSGTDRNTGKQTGDFTNKIDQIVEYEEKYLKTRQGQGKLLKSNDPSYLNLFDNVYYLRAMNHLDLVDDSSIDPLIKRRRSRKVDAIMAKADRAAERLESLKEKSTEYLLDSSRREKSVENSILNQTLERFIRQSRSPNKDNKNRILITPANKIKLESRRTMQTFNSRQSDGLLNIMDGLDRHNQIITRSPKLSMSMASTSVKSTDRPSTTFMAFHMKRMKNVQNRKKIVDFRENGKLSTDIVQLNTDGSDEIGDSVRRSRNSRNIGELSDDRLNGNGRPLISVRKNGLKNRGNITVCGKSKAILFSSKESSHELLFNKTTKDIHSNKKGISNHRNTVKT